MTERRKEINAETSRKQNRIWCCVLLVLFGMGLWVYIGYADDLYTIDEINAQLCREVIAEDFFQLDGREIPLDKITIVGIETINDIVIAGYICDANYATHYGEKGYLMFKPREDGQYYIKECYHEYNPYEMWEKPYVTGDTGKIYSVSTVYGKEDIAEKSCFIFISDDPTMEKIYISNDDKFKQINTEVEVEKAPFMTIVELPKMREWHITYKSVEMEPGRYVASFFSE